MINLGLTNLVYNNKGFSVARVFLVLVLKREQNINAWRELASQ